MKKNIKIFATVTLAVVIGSMTFIFAQTSKQTNEQISGGGGQGFRPPPPMGGPGGGGGLLPHVLDKLNLTDAQKQQIKILQEMARSNSKGDFDKIKTFDDRLKAMMDGGTFNEDQAREILNGKAQIMIEVEIVRLRTDAAIKNLLTADQKTQLEQLKQQHPDFGRGRRPDIPPPPPQN